MYKRQDYHRQVRTTTQQTPYTQDNQEFTSAEIQYAIEDMDPKKVPDKDSITGTIHLYALRLVTAFYNECLRTGNFLKISKRAKLVPIVKSGKENSVEISLNKFRPIGQ